VKGPLFITAEEKSKRTVLCVRVCVCVCNVAIDCERKRGEPQADRALHITAESDNCFATADAAPPSRRTPAGSGSPACPRFTAFSAMQPFDLVARVPTHAHTHTHGARFALTRRPLPFRAWLILHHPPQRVRRGAATRVLPTSMKATVAHLIHARVRRRRLLPLKLLPQHDGSCTQLTRARFPYQDDTEQPQTTASVAGAKFHVYQVGAGARDGLCRAAQRACS